MGEDASETSGVRFRSFPCGDSQTHARLHDEQWSDYGANADNENWNKSGTTRPLKTPYQKQQSREADTDRIVCGPTDDPLIRVGSARLDLCLLLLSAFDVRYLL